MYVMQAKRRTTLTSPARKRIAITVFLVFALDNVSKSLAIKFLHDQPVQILGRFLTLHLRFNSGAAFSLGTSRTLVFSSIAIAAVAGLLVYAKRVTNAWWALALGLILGGVLGNLSDRIFRPPGFLQGQVVDWIELPHWPTFNVADSSIVGAAVLVVLLSARNIKPTD